MVDYAYCLPACLPACLLACLSAFSSLQIQASNSLGTPLSIDQMMQTADFAFRGTVVDVNYKNSKRTNGAEGPPYTFVTYQISEVISGSYDNPSITLRFAGGKIDGENVLLISHMPLFDVGDEDILFVSGNTKSECPLVGCIDGRVRVINSHVYAEEGEQLVSSAVSSHLVYKGVREASTIVDENDMGGLKLKWVESAPLPSNTKRIAKSDENSLANKSSDLIHISVSDFSSSLKPIQGTLSKRIAERRSVSIASANINDDLVIDESLPAAQPDTQLTDAARFARQNGSTSTTQPELNLPDFSQKPDFF